MLKRSAELALFVLFVVVAAVRAHDDPASQPAPRTMRIQVIDAATSEPLPNVSVTVANEAEDAQDSAGTDENGECQITLKCQGSSETVQFFRDGYVPTQAVWDWDPDASNEKHSADDLPKTFELNLSPAQELSGIVTDDDNNPIPNVAVMLLFSPQDRAHRSWPTIDLAKKQLDEYTQAQGNWTTRCAPQDLSQLQVLFGHNDYVFARRTGDKVETIKLVAGIRLGGKVCGPDGEPIADARVACFDTEKYGGRRSNRTDRTDANGEFLLSALPPGNHTMTVYADGFIHEAINIDLRPETRMDVKMSLAHTIRGTIVSPAGAPIANVRVTSEPLPGAMGEYIEGYASPTGEFALNGCPDTPLRVEFQADGYQKYAAKFEPDSQNTVTLQPLASDRTPATQPTSQPGR